MEIFLQSILKNPGFVHFAYVSAAGAVSNTKELVFGTATGISLFSLVLSVTRTTIQLNRDHHLPFKILALNGFLLLMFLTSCIGFIISLLQPDQSLKNTDSFGSLRLKFFS